MTARTNLYLDRFEGDLAILVGEAFQIELPRRMLPAGSREGDFLSISIISDPEAREKMTAEIEAIRRRLQEGGAS